MSAVATNWLGSPPVTGDWRIVLDDARRGCAAASWLDAAALIAVTSRAMTATGVVDALEQVIVALRDAGQMEVVRALDGWRSQYVRATQPGGELQ